MLRTIGNNIANAAQGADALEISVQGVTKQIDLLDSTTGDMRSTFDIMQDIFTSGWENMTNAEKQALAISLAGKNQFEVFVSVLENFADAQKAVMLATDSAGSAEKENAAYLDSLGAKLNQAKALLQELVLGDGGLEKFGKTLLDVGISILKFANSDIGQAIIKIGLITTGITLASKAFAGLSTAVIANGQSLATYLLISQGYSASVATATASTMGFTASLEMLTSVWLLSPFGIATITIAGIAGIVAVINKLNPSLDKLNEKVTEANSEYKQATDNISSLETELESVRSQIEQIKSQGKLEITDETQLTLLEKQEASLERQLVLQRANQEAAQREATKAGTKVLGKQVTDEGAFGTTMSYEGVEIANTGTTVDALNAYVDKINEVETEIEGLIAKKQELINAGQTESDEYNNLNDQIDKLVQTQNSYKDSATEYANAISDATENADQNNETIQKGIEALDGYSDAMENVWNQTDNATNSSSNVGDALAGISDAADSAAESADKLASAWEEWNTAVDDIQSAYDTLSSAVQEYNTQGGYTLDTLQELLALDPAYLSALQEKNGQMTLNIDVIKQKIEAQANEAKQIIYNTAIEKLNAIASGEAGTASSEAAAEHNAATTGIDNETSSLLKNTQAQYANAIAKARARGGSAAREEINQVIQWTQEAVGAVDKYVSGLGTSFDKAMGTATKATNRATNAINKQKQALQNAKKALQEERDAKVKEVEAQIKALEKQYNAEKKAIEDERDTQIDAIEAEIDALEKERDARKDYWEQQLNYLEAQNQVVEDGIELQQLYNDLATAQQTKKMVFKDGRFVYTSDEATVSTAQDALDEFNRKKEYEKQKAYLENLRDMEDKNYEDRLDDLKSFKEERQKHYEDLLDQLKEHYEEEKDALEDYRDKIKDKYDKQLSDLENQKDALNGQYNQMLNNQRSFQNNSLASAQAYVNQYNAIMRGLANGGVTTVSKDEGIKVGGKTTSTTIGEALAGGAARRRSNAKSTGDNYVNGYATGVGSVNDSQLSVVGENPKYREFVIGSRLNNDQGVLMTLKRGSGVVNAKATNTLASIFNALTGQRSVGQTVNSSSSNSTMIEIGSISLPQVTDGQGFINFLQNFKTDLTQRAFKR